jgi:nitroreductase
MMRTEKEQENFLGQIVYRLNPTMQAIGAAIENLTLKAVELGYGTCWQTGPNSAWKEVTAVLKDAGFEKPGYDITAFMPLGIPEDDQSSPGRKPLDEILTII